MRETKRRIRDGSWSLTCITHNERHPETDTFVAKIIHSFGLAD